MGPQVSMISASAICAVKSVGAAGDEADLVVERLGAALVDAEADRGEDPVAVLADGCAEPDKRLEAAAGQAAEQPVDRHLDIVEVEAGFEDAADGLFERVGAPHLAAGGLDPGEGGGLLVGQALGSLEQAPAGVLETLGGLMVADERSSSNSRGGPRPAPGWRALPHDRVDADDCLRGVGADRLRVAGAHVERDTAQQPGAREDRGLDFQAGLKPCARDAVVGRDCRASAKRDDDRRLTHRAQLRCGIRPGRVEL